VLDGGRVRVNHAVGCRCERCRSNAYGQWLYDVGKATAAGKWGVFGTSTFRPRNDVWRKGFPSSKGTSPAFAHRLFAALIGFLEAELCTRVDYFVADQLGFVGGKFHQHFLLSALGLDSYPRQNISSWLFTRAGFSRVLPAKHGAERYVGRFVAANPEAANWDLRIGDTTAAVGERMVGKRPVVLSADVTRNHFYSRRRC